MYSRAYNLARKCHKDQVDKVGVPYIHHVQDVAFRCATEEQKTVALLHDTIEDGGMTPDKLRAFGFDETIVDAVVAITRNQGEDYFDFIRRCAQNPIARKVKMHDIEHNLEVIRFARKCKPITDIRAKEFRKHGPFVLNEEDLFRLNKYLMAHEMLRAIDNKEAFDNAGFTPDWISN
jgi:(p)ppGpp synthase/HD superfamily hydrolase